MSTNEEWMPVVGYEGIYEVSCDGHVRRTVPAGPNKSNGGLMSQVVGHRGYPTVQLWKDRTRKLRTVHQLMMESFVGPRQQGIEVDHIDGNKLNNSLNNLEYVSKRENLRRRDALGLTHRGERTGGSKLKDSNITEILSLRYKGESYSSIAKKLGVSTTAIFNAAKGRTWRHVER